MKKLIILISCLTLALNLSGQNMNLQTQSLSTGSWSTSLRCEQSLFEFQFWDKYQHNSHDIKWGLELPWFYFGPFYKKGLISELFNPLNNRANSMVFSEIAGFDPDKSLEPGKHTLIFLGQDSGGYLLYNWEGVLVQGIIVNCNLLKGLDLALHYSLSQPENQSSSSWFYTQKPFLGQALFHPAVGLNYENKILRFCIYGLSSISSLKQLALCASGFFGLTMENIQISSYFGVKEPDYYNPFGLTTKDAFEGHFSGEWHFSKELVLAQSYFYELKWPEHPYAPYFPMVQESLSSFIWKAYEFRHNSASFNTAFFWKQSHNEEAWAFQEAGLSLGIDFVFNGFSGRLDGSLKKQENYLWTFEYDVNYKGQNWEWHFSHSWEFSADTKFDHSFRIQRKLEQGKLFFQINSQKALTLFIKNSLFKDFFKHHCLTLGWKSEILLNKKGEQ